MTTVSEPSPLDLSAIRAALLRWYDDAKRDLPWRRRADDPYAVWVSEIMLQQTRVDTVIPYYERFLERFPDARALAAASEDEVLGAWSGLGYYRRARLLHRGVQEVVATYGGEVPRGAAERLGLPGVGRYTAGAIGSVAFDLPEAIVDGNVARVLSRVALIEAPLRSGESEKALWSLATQLVAGERPGDFNQSMMELGALVCSPRSPSCEECPLSDHCRARATGVEEQLPRTPKKRVPKREHWAAVVATSRGRVALLRGDQRLYGGLYAPPMTPVASEEDIREAALRALSSAGITARLGDRSVGDVSHTLTHKRLEVSVLLATHARLRPDSEAIWIPKGRPLPAGIGVARLSEKILKAASRTSLSAG